MHHGGIDHNGGMGHSGGMHHQGAITDAMTPGRRGSPAALSPPHA